MGNQGIIRFGVLPVAILFLTQCGEDKSRRIKTEPVAPVTPVAELVETPAFNADSAYAYVQRQVDFGPRVPNTEEHRKCAGWLEAKLQSFGLETIVQEATVKAYNGIDLQIYNIMGRYRPEEKRRIMLSAHWDTRPYADRDDKNRTKPIDGANDGGSGVAVLLEIARVISLDSAGPGIGYDIVFFDAEDYGKPQSSMVGQSTNSWCLGSQYWSRNIPVEDYRAEYGILLDMVGADNAVFPQEGASLYYAPKVIEKVWGIARALGHRNYFMNIRGNELIDDHRPLNEIAGIPTIDIVHYEMYRNDFGTFHHTHADNMDGISRGTLGVVGEVVLQVMYQE